MLTHVPSLRRRTAAGLAVAVSLALAVPAIQAASAHADTAPVAPVTTPTVSADALPTVQIDGVVWAQVVVGNRVYATGQFANARPAGAAAGTNQTPRSNILAYDLTTGALITSWAPSLNAQGMAIAASADGTKIYVAGDFTTVDGATHNRIVALDATTGAPVPGFAASLNAQARALAVAGTTVYAGGSFTAANGSARGRLAAFDGTTGKLLDWAPRADQEVMALTAVAGANEVVVGGHLKTLNGVTVNGMGAVDATSGTNNLPWAVNRIAYDYGADAAIYSLTNDGSAVYGTGYNYLIHNDPTTAGNFENTFSATAVGGNLIWISGCRGDTYSAAVLGGVVYNVGHAHNCSPIGGHPQTNPETYQRALAYQAAPAADGRVNIGDNFNGRPAPELLHWYPTIAQGTYTRQYQGAWSVTGNSSYVVLGGEFPRVNEIPQQGLVRFAVRSIAPDKEGPQDYTGLKPTVTGIAPGTVRVSWPATYDRDNRQLTYEVLRGATTSTAAVLSTRTQSSAWFDRPPMAFTDRTATPGSSQTYRIRVKDAFGNTLTGAGTTVTVPAGTAASSPYADAVTADAPTNYWRLGEASGTTAYDWASGNDETLAADTRRGAAGALSGDGDTASTFSGSATVPGTSATAVTGPQTFSVEAWFRTTSTSGGKIVGFGNSTTADSGSYDRHVYMTNTGKVVFGVYDDAVSTLTSSAGYNDGAWHQVVGTLGPGGMTLYVDGAKLASRTDVTFAQGYRGYWRIGGDNLHGWSDQPSSSTFAGSIDEVAVYPTVLPDARVAAHYSIAKGTAPANRPPVASFTASTSNLTVSVDGSASSDPDGTVASYAWDFSDGGTGTGASATHTYAMAGTYTVRLTVTDDKGATSSTTTSVTVTAATTALASDAFPRTVANGWGSADAGGAWTVSGTSGNFAVSGGVGTMRMGAAGAGPSAGLTSVSSSGTEVQVTMSADKVGTGNGVFLYAIGRRTTGGDYQGRVRLLSNGTVAIAVSKQVSGTETVLGSEITLPGVTYTAGTRLRVRLQVQGTGTTTLRLKVWPVTGTEPASWQVTQTDTTTGLQAAGSIALAAYLSGSATNPPVVAGFHDLVATAV